MESSWFEMLNLCKVHLLDTTCSKQVQNSSLIQFQLNPLSPRGTHPDTNEIPLSSPKMSPSPECLKFPFKLWLEQAQWGDLLLHPSIAARNSTMRHSRYLNIHFPHHKITFCHGIYSASSAQLLRVVV